MADRAVCPRPCSLGRHVQVFKEWGFDETSAAAQMEERHLQDMGVKIGHIPVIMHEIRRLKVCCGCASGVHNVVAYRCVHVATGASVQWARMEIDKLEEARIVEEDKARRKAVLDQADRYAELSWA